MDGRFFFFFLFRLKNELIDYNWCEIKIEKRKIASLNERDERKEKIQR